METENKIKIESAQYYMNSQKNDEFEEIPFFLSTNLKSV